MFRQTRLRLVSLNAIVVLFILCSFSAIIYVYMQFRLFASADASLVNMAQHLYNDGLTNPEIFLPHVRDRDRRIYYLLWDSNQQLVQQIPEPIITYADDIKTFRQHLSDMHPYTVSHNSERFRAMTVQLPFPTFDGITWIQLVQSMGPEQNMLDSLLVVIAVSGAAGVLISVLAGFFLADRALVPIRRSWSKQQQFVADASHELRTPLSVIQTHAELLLRHPTHTIEQESQTVSTILGEGKRMARLVGDLLTLARSDSNQMQIEHRPLNVADTLTNVVQQFQFLMETKGIVLHSSIDSPLTVLGDEGRLRQLFVILLDNAFKYTEAGGSVYVSGRKQHHTVTIIVKDTGIGIPKSDLPLVFERFYRADKARSRAEGGTGLGLSIAKWIVEAHGGKIRAESEPEKGTTMTVTLPSKE